MAMIHRGASGDEAWDIYQRWLSRGLLLGLDAGNTVIKAVLFDRDGRQLASASATAPRDARRPATSSATSDELWAQRRRGDPRLPARRPASTPATVAAIGCAGHGNGLYLLDADGRAADRDPVARHARRRARRGAAADGIGDAAARDLPAAALAVADADAARLDAPPRARALRPRRHGLLLQGLRDLPADRAPGQRHLRHVRRRLLRLPDGRYDDDLLAPTAWPTLERHAARPRSSRPTSPARSPPRPRPRPGSPRARRSSPGSSTSSPARSAPGRQRPGEASIIAGTWSINQVDLRRADRRPARLHGLGASARTASWPSKSAPPRPPISNGTCASWSSAAATHDDPFGACNRRVAAVTPPARRPLFHPFLYGSRRRRLQRAGFYGLAGWHGEGHLLRALFEGVIFEHRRHIEVLRGAGVRFDSATLSGGGARSPVWPQMFADVLGIPITVAACSRDRRARRRHRRRRRRRRSSRISTRPCGR